MIVNVLLLQRKSIAKQFADQVRIRLISQLINDISRVLQRLLKYFNGTLIFCTIFRSVCYFRIRFKI